MPKSVFQQLVEQTCAQANLKPINNKQKTSSASSSALNEKRETSNQKPPSPVAKIIADQISAMDAANKAPRCQHIKSNGVRCASPAMRKLEFCFFHEKFYNPPYEDSLPPLEDANSVQCAILQVLNGLKTKAIGLPEARVMLYGLKAASINARRTTFEPIMQAQVVEYPGSRQKEVCHPERSEGPAVGRAAALQEFHQAVKDQASAVEAAKPPSSAPDVGAHVPVRATSN